ncbi:hypothetical protein Mal4_22740 [Maioricimonas rarisocia]|uniref:SPW repeat-containing integral membrane domain-containing protein n=1 Tax=Maioricimonas rarisocia TaxID=2528026 RepID=A0A517Z671_9PLAN|nr:SPW repeat protein [Maioricimonas rarisocia]QDU37955.1 hypothetical protein Mal4_22740 [Maioricimonas rarisocia]
MWSRVVEIMLGCWLVISPFIFSHPDNQVSWWINDMACGSAVILFGLLSYWHPLRRIHLATFAVAGWLIVYAYIRSVETTGAVVQNNAALGLLLMMFAIIPNEASQPPEPWRLPAGEGNTDTGHESGSGPRDASAEPLTTSHR